MKYKRAASIGFVHRIYRAFSNWQNFHGSLERAKSILLKNLYPSSVTEKLIHETLSKIIKCEAKKKDGETSEDPFLQYRGKCSERYASDLSKTGVPIRVVFTLRKIRTVTSSLKEPLEKTLRSGVIYQLTSPRCTACYVGALKPLGSENENAGK